VRGALTKADGFSNIKTEVDTKTCTFNYTKSETELKAQLDELAKSNSHIRDWSKKN
jgi:hypothetical protein